jgi:hypothetical protein
MPLRRGCSPGLSAPFGPLGVVVGNAFDLEPQEWLDSIAATEALPAAAAPGRGYV